nr:heavy metal-associated isoprenylated plant protein 3-like [Ipomoea batatas]
MLCAGFCGEQKKNQKGESGEQKKAGGGKKEGGGGGDNASVVLKADLHCEGCISKIVKTIRGCDGVEDVKVELSANKVTVTGKVDPAVVKEKVEAKTHKQVPAVTTAVLKMNLHCEGCIQKIYKIVSKTKGYHEMKLDRQKEVVTVTGAMDMKALVENLKKHLKRDVEIVPPKKEGGGGEKKEKGGGGGGNEKGNDKGKGGGKKEGGGGGGGDGEKNKEEAANKMQMFSDENPNACSVM